MKASLQDIVLAQLYKLTADPTMRIAITQIEPIQSLWSGYGDILRLGFQYEELGDEGTDDQCKPETLIVKYVSLPDNITHPRGWHTDFSHQRKIRSYAVESYWYREMASGCDDHCRVPQCFAAHSQGRV